jgi:hypothetical protein
MNINVHIERLVLDGLSLASGQSDSVQTAVETQLTRLLSDKGFACSSAYTVPHVSAAPIQLPRDTKSSLLGHQIARAIYGSLTPTAAFRRETGFLGGQSG